MQNSESDPLPFASKNLTAVENKLFVAATVAAVVLAGSAIAYRHVATNPASPMRLFWKDSRGSKEELESEKRLEGTIGPDAKIALRTVSTSTTTYATGQQLEHNAGNTSATTKSSRPKDRRKRGKDPLREVLKSGKKLKSFPSPTGSFPPSPTPPAAILSSSMVGKEKRVGENTELSFEATRAHILDASQLSSKFQRIPTTGIQREGSPSTPAPPAIHRYAGHSRDVSQHSRSTHDEEAEDGNADFSGTSSYIQDAHTHIQSPNSLSQSSLSLPRSLSSLADVSEGEPGDGGWVTSVSKARSKLRGRLEDVMFEDGMARTEEKTRGEVTESHSNSTIVFEGTSMFPPSNGAPISFLSTDLPLHASCSDTNSETGDAHQLHNSSSPWLPLPPIDPSSQHNEIKARRAPMQGKREYPLGLPDPTHWDSASTSQSTALSPANPIPRDMGSHEVLHADLEDHEQENDRKQSRFQPKGSGGTGYTSFSSAVTGGGGRIAIGQCQTGSVTAAVASRVSVSRSGLTETEACPPAPGVNDGDMEFTFPTLNPQATTSSSGPSTRARSTLMDTSVSSSSPSKKNKRFSSSKNGTPPPNAPPSRTSSPSITRENHTHSQGPNATGGSTGTPALSAQTQLASLRGALEAARLREEKHKTEMEKLTKELEMLKWETTNSRRGEVELQSQVRQLTHQLQGYAALFASVAPHLTSEFALQPTPNDPEGSSPKIDPSVELPNGVDPSAPESPELEQAVAEAQEEEAVSPSDKAQGQNHSPALPPTQQPLQLPSSSLSDIASPFGGAQHPISSPSSAATPTFFPYYLPTQHPQFPVHHPPWAYHPYQPQQSTQNLSGTAGGPSSPPPPRHYANVYSPTMYSISPVLPPLSPQNIGMMSPQLLHQYQPFGFGGGLRSAGASSTGSHSPEMTGPSSVGAGLNKPRPRIRRRKSQLANLNGNAKAGWEDIGDGWIGLSKVIMQPAAANLDNGRITDEGATVDREGEDDNVESASSPYSELLANAILKRSSTIRPSKKNGKKENGPPINQEGAEEIEPFTEFTFPTLSNVSNNYYRTASRTESSVSSSLSSSPPSTTATVPDLIGDPGWEEDKSSLPPVIENAEDLDPLVSDVILQGTTDVPLSKVEEITVTHEATPKKEDHEQPLTDKLEQ